MYVSSNVIPNYLLPYDLITDKQIAITGFSNVLQANINTANNTISATNNSITNNYNYNNFN